MTRLVIVAALLLGLTACGADNTDPRKGRVTLDSSNCLFGGCYDLYEFCLGPDLHIVYDESGDDDYKRTDENSPECEVPR